MADLNSLLVFVKVVEHKTFSEAARRLRMPLSTVSRRVAELEDQLGVRLLERSTRSLRLTDVGAEVLEHARRGAEVSDAIDSVVSEQRSRVAGLVRLSCPPSITDSLLAPITSAFQREYPDVRIEVLVSERMVDLVGEGIDLALRLGALEDSALVAKKVLRYRHQLVASPSYLRSRKPPRRPSDLQAHRLLAFSYPKSTSTWRFVRKGRVEVVPLVPHLSMNDFAGLAAALAAGDGIGDLPPLVMPQLLASGALVEVMPEWRLPKLDLQLVHMANRHLARPVRLFKELAVERAAALFPSLPG